MKLSQNIKMMQVILLILTISFLGPVAVGGSLTENRSDLALNLSYMSKNFSEIVTGKYGNGLLENATINISLYYIEEALELDKDLQEACVHKCDLLIQSKRYEEALSYCDELLAEDPMLCDIWYEKGLALDELGRWSESVECYDRAICCFLKQGSDCDDTICVANVWFLEANDYKRMNDNSKALLCYIKSIDTCNNDSITQRVQCWLAKGDTLLEMGRYNESIDCFNEAITLKNSSHSKESAIAYQKMGLAQLLLAKNLSSKDPCQSALNLYTQSYISFERSIHAFEYLKNCRSALPAYFGKGVALSFLPGRGDDSRAAFSKAAEILSGKENPYLKWIANSLQWIFEKAKGALDYAKSRTA
jgi:tetratricopeptide (TPR) repeat protein